MTGAIEGRFDIFDKLAKLHMKNEFSLALILGDLFADPAQSSEAADDAIMSLLDGKVNVPFTTYFTLGGYPLPRKVQVRLEETDGEVCSNLYFLGKHSVTKTSEGLRIVTLGGSLNPDLTVGLSKDTFSPFHTEGDAKALQSAKSADILITSQWPSTIRSGSSVRLPSDIKEPPNEPCIADLCSCLQPRYHLSTSPQLFYEREPFTHADRSSHSDLQAVTRFISLAAYSNAAKQKWLYAFSIDTTVAPPTTLPPGTTASPLMATPSRKRQRLDDQEESYQRFSRHDHGQYLQRGPKRARGPPPGPESCFFCLSNPNIATHLITSIGNDSYLTTAKGPLTTSKTFPSLAFPAHVLIIPLSHSPTFSSMNPQEMKVSTYTEMNRYRKELQLLIGSASKGALGSVCWEINRGENIHIHWQLLPVPVDLVKKGLVDAGFRVEAENERYPTLKAKNIGDGSGEQGDYLRVWTWHPGEGVDSQLDGNSGHLEDTGKETSLLLPLTSNIRFDLQFPRKVMAKLLGLEGRMRWQDCGQGVEEETLEAEAFKKCFEPFDFSLEGT